MLADLMLQGLMSLCGNWKNFGVVLDFGWRSGSSLR